MCMQHYEESFDPHPGMPLEIGANTFTWMPDPLFPEDDEVFARQGTEAVLYRMREQSTGALWALKVFHPGFNSTHLTEVTHALSRYAGLPGLSCAWRYCLTRATAPAAVTRHPALEHAVLMPWIEGRSWAGFLLDRAAGERYTAIRALTLARMLSAVLGHMETQGIAHTDIAGGNIVLSPTWDALELVDIERMYMPAGPRPLVVSNGSPGYAFQHLDAAGQWCPAGDRFAGAIVLVEMLAWADPAVRAATPEESDTLFDDSDLQSLDCERWQLARDALWSFGPAALALFDQVWNASDLLECPPLSAWADVLHAVETRTR